MVANLWGLDTNSNGKLLSFDAKVEFSFVIEYPLYYSWAEYHFFDFRRFAIIVMHHNENTWHSLKRNKAISLCKSPSEPNNVSKTLLLPFSRNIGDENLQHCCLLSLVYDYYGLQRCNVATWPDVVKINACSNSAMA